MATDKEVIAALLTSYQAAPGRSNADALTDLRKDLSHDYESSGYL